MNEAVMQYLQIYRKEIELCDWAKILTSKNSPQKQPQTHPGREASLAYINIILNYARRSIELTDIKRNEKSKKVMRSPVQKKCHN